MRYTRTFHTVGQGAFYSEEIACDGKRIFRMVYDCGSTSLTASQLKKRVNSDFSNDMEVDVLFISHFDEDHINGVKYLNPKTVILPFLSADQIEILRLYNRVSGGTYDIVMVEAPELRFPNSRIIRVLPENTSESYNYNNGDEGLLTINIDDNSSEGTNTESIESKTKVLFGNGKPLWEYIPLNPNWDKYISKFKDELQRTGLDWDSLIDRNNADYFKSKEKILKGIYNTLKPKNEHSLVVYSNPVDDIKIKDCFRCCAPCFPYFIYDLPFGCLYFGDIKIEDKWKAIFYNFLDRTGRLSRVGTVQIPHHGSYLSDGDKVFSSAHPFALPILCVISVGEFNHFGHPSAHVINELHRNGGVVKMVTETVSSLCSYYSY